MVPARVIILKCKVGISLAIQWLWCCASIIGGMGSIPGWGTKIPLAAWHGQKKRKKKKGRLMKPFPSSESFKGSHCLMELSSNSVLFHPFVILLMLFPLPGMPLLTVYLTTPPHLLGLGSGISSSWHLSWHLALRQNWPQPPLYQWFPSPPFCNNITYHIGNFLFPYLTPSLDVKLLVYESCIKG